MKTTIRKKLLLAGAAVAVIGTGVASKPAMAFEEVNWTWDKIVTENVVKDVDVDIISNPSGMVEIEKIQTHVGDVTATSTVSNITNNPPTDETGEPAPAPIPTDFVLDLKAKYDDNELDNPITSVELLNDDETGLSLSNPTGHVDNNNEKIYMTFDLTVPVEQQPAPGPQPIEIGERLAVDLPQVASTATAVGNNQDISSSVSVELHDAQYLFGDATGETGSLDGLFDGEETGNTHTNAASDLIAAIATGGIESANVTADSSVSAILNATVDSSATAVGNNMSVDLAAFTPDDAFMIADVTQFSYADVTATSMVDDVTIEGYSDMGAAGLGPVPLDIDGTQTPIANSVATAVGNNFSVTVNSPDL